ncbi:MAG: hypothetical protein OXB86_03845, partial [Bdellovibrionales bacterium]|nr:hypothetical protein [Bdellovibrionales bacterium]
LNMERKLRELQEQNTLLRQILLKKHLETVGTELVRNDEFQMNTVLGVYGQIAVICYCIDEDVKMWPESIAPFKEGLNEAISDAEKSCKQTDGSLGACKEILI